MRWPYLALCCQLLAGLVERQVGYDLAEIEAERADAVERGVHVVFVGEE